MHIFDLYSFRHSNFGMDLNSFQEEFHDIEQRSSRNSGSIVPNGVSGCGTEPMVGLAGKVGSGYTGYGYNSGKHACILFYWSMIGE